MATGPDDDLLPCIECEAVVAPGTDRAFPVGTADVLCMACALRRGGAYDEIQDRWKEAPDLTGVSIDEGHPRHQV